MKSIVGQGITELIIFDNFFSFALLEPLKDDNEMGQTRRSGRTAPSHRQ
jgi:hypothetical protein